MSTEPSKSKERYGRISRYGCNTTGPISTTFLKMVLLGNGYHFFNSSGRPAYTLTPQSSSVENLSEISNLRAFRSTLQVKTTPRSTPPLIFTWSLYSLFKSRFNIGLKETFVSSSSSGSANSELIIRSEKMSSRAAGVVTHL